MPDPRVTRLAKVLIHYSLELKAGQELFLWTSPLADELNLAVLEEAIKVGAHVDVSNEIPGAKELFFKYASDAQLDYYSPTAKMRVETFDALLRIDAKHNTRSLSGVDPERMARYRSNSYSQFMKTYMERTAKKELNWVITVFPTTAMAQEADMSLPDYREFVYGAGMLNEDDPVAVWREEGKKQQKLIDWLNGRKQAVLKGENVDMTMSVEGRIFVPASGQNNFPDGEIYTSPIEDSANGWIRFRYPAIYDGQEIHDIELWFEDGKVVKEKAGKNQELLTALLDTDAGSRFLGEWGIGTNYGIQRFTKNLLFDEKIGGTIHLAVGAAILEAGGKNESGLHWDMICDMHDAEVTLDGDLFYKDGKPVI
ncbi:MAG: aminopeptidase [Chloroflexi bacterium]|nr:aminopeptidase [Chloroflexota bacterium]